MRYGCGGDACIHDGWMTARWIALSVCAGWCMHDGRSHIRTQRLSVPSPVIPTPTHTQQNVIQNAVLLRKHHLLLLLFPHDLSDAHMVGAILCFV